MHDATTDPAARQRNGKNMTPVIATTLLIELGCTPKLTHAHHQRVVQHVSIDQVV